MIYNIHPPILGRIDLAEKFKLWRKKRMKRRIRLFAWIIPTVVLLFACSTSQVASIKDTVGAAVTAVNAEATAAGAQATAAGGQATVATGKATVASSTSEIFKDDFSDSSSGWDTITDASGTTDYSDGKYLISVPDASTYLFATPSTLADTTDVRIEVDVLKSDDVPHDMGIICRYQDSDNFYYLLVSSDGYFAIGKFKAGTEELIGTTDMRPDKGGVVHPGAADNHLRADCIGDTLTLYANGTKLFQVQDSDFVKGNVGLIAGSYKDTPITVYFDNFVVTKP
jgi:hypothetical protein